MFRASQKVTPDKLKPGDVVALRFLVSTNAIPVIHRLKAYPPAPPAPAPVAPEPLPPPPPAAPATPGG